MEAGQYLRIKLFFPSRSVFNVIEMVTQVVWMDAHLRKDWGGAFEDSLGGRPRDETKGGGLNEIIIEEVRNCSCGDGTRYFRIFRSGWRRLEAI